MSAPTGRRLLLALLCAAAGLRLLAQAWTYSREVLQLDLSAYVTAGEALGRGLDPYRTHPDHRPPVWDGKAAFQHSRFLYPPLVAVLFRPLAALPYSVAKGAFTLVSLLALGLATLLLWRGAGARSGDALLLLLALLASAFPVATLLERGQVDAITLLLLVLAFRPALRGKQPGLVSGVLLALATLLKLNTAALVPFFALRRWWRGLLGYALGGAGLIALGLVAHGPALFGRYAEELPRIARYGEDGTPAMRLPEETVNRLRGDAPPGFAWRDGRLYRLEAMGFAANASGARTLAHLLGLQRPRAGLAPLALLILGVSWALAAWALSPRPPSSPVEELAFLVMGLAAVLLAGPLTWVMNVAWLVAGGVLLAKALPARNGVERFALAALATGLFLAWLPDASTFAPLLGHAPWLWEARYVAAETLVLLSTAAFLRARLSSAPD